MLVGLYNLEPKIYNTALMQVSFYHKQQGDDVELYNHLTPHKYDKVYAFSIFEWTNKSYVTPNMIVGGTGFNIQSKLPPEIERCNLDYSIYPSCNTSYIWFSRGCIRNCPFCIVPQKEGKIHPVEPKNLNPKGEFITVMDNNFFANPQWREAIEWLMDTKQKVDINQGIDVRIITDEMIDVLVSLPTKAIRIAWDDPKKNLVPNIKKMLKKISPHKMMCYVLIGYSSTQEEDYHRVMTLRDLQIDPFVMPYNKFDRYQMIFGNWVNNKVKFHVFTWEEYAKTKRVQIPSSKKVDNLEMRSLVGSND